MDFFDGLIFVLAFGPLLGVGSVAADARSGGRPLTARRLIMAATIAGAILASPIGCVVAVGPHNVSPLNLPIALLVGAAYGCVVGGLLLGVKSLWSRRRDHTA